MHIRGPHTLGHQAPLNLLGSPIVCSRDSWPPLSWDLSFLGTWRWSQRQEGSFQFQLPLKGKDSGVRQDYNSPGLLEPECWLAPTWRWQRDLIPAAWMVNPTTYGLLYVYSLASSVPPRDMWLPWHKQSPSEFIFLPQCISVAPLEHAVNPPSLCYVSSGMHFYMCTIKLTCLAFIAIPWH